MEVMLFADHVAELNEGIRQDIIKRVSEFKDCTGVTPAKINVHVFELTTHNHKTRQYGVGGVEVQFGL